MTDRELMQQSLQALEFLSCGDEIDEALIVALRQRLEQPEQEPVAWPCHIIEADFSERTITLGMQSGDYKVSAGTHYLSTTQPQRTWVGLTDEEMVDLQDRCGISIHQSDFEAIEAKLKEKNT